MYITISFNILHLVVTSENNSLFKDIIQIGEGGSAQGHVKTFGINLILTLGVAKTLSNQANSALLK